MTGLLPLKDTPTSQTLSANIVVALFGATAPLRQRVGRLLSSKPQPAHSPTRHQTCVSGLAGSQERSPVHQQILRTTTGLIRSDSLIDPLP